MTGGTRRKRTSRRAVSRRGSRAAAATAAAAPVRTKGARPEVVGHIRHAMRARLAWLEKRIKDDPSFMRQTEQQDILAAASLFSQDIVRVLCAHSSHHDTSTRRDCACGRRGLHQL